MKTNVYFSLLAICIPAIVFSQMGINKPGADSTLDIVSKTTDGTQPEGILPPRLTGDQIQLADDQYTASHTGNIVYALFAASSPSLKTANIDKAGYYFFDGDIWQKLNDGPGSNIYSTDGSLTENRIVNMEDKVLSFTSVPSSGTTHFQVAGTTFNINTILGNTGMGTNNPLARLQVDNSDNNAANTFTIGINNCGTPCGGQTPSHINLYNSNFFASIYPYINFSASSSPLGVNPGAVIYGIERSGTLLGMQFAVRNSATYTPAIHIKNTGVVRINSTLQGGNEMLSVNGSITNTSAFDAGNSSLIDFSKSNLAFTTADPGAFTLTNIKDGGAYALTVQGAVSGLSTFSATGFTIRYSNNSLTTSGTHTMYKLLVMGADVYVTMIAGF
ncbi:hypothetical protein [Chryseobacterium sp. KCF3-3]|uniref:hypothetical protein n=1 Tax=Chryseobacterium sp. KCF3-3 TaxID=3231511 RepID=UPI0038B34ACB